MANEFYVKKEGDKIVLTIVTKTETSIELDIEDAADMALDIQQYIQQYINSNSDEYLRNVMGNDYNITDEYLESVKNKSETSILSDIEIKDAFDDLFNDVTRLDDIKSNENDAYAEKAKMQAKAQNDSKNKLTLDMNKWINNHFGSKYDLDPIEREVKEREIEKLFGETYTIDLINNTATKKK